MGELKLKSLSLSPINVKCEFEKTLPKPQSDQKPIVVWHTEFIKAKEQEIGKGIRSYKGTFNKFRTFLDKKGTILFEHLNKGLLDEFKQHLIKLGLEGPHLHKQFKNLRIFINWVKGNQEEHEQEIKIPSAYKQVKVKARYGDPIGLTVKQFLEFYQLDLSRHKELERTRNLFVFWVSIGGPRHGDLKKLGNSLRRFGFNVQSNCINFFEGKTGNAHNDIIVNKFGLEILEKEDYIFPHVPSNTRMNKNLKSIAKKTKMGRNKIYTEI